METITAHIRVENECTNKHITEEEKNTLPPIAESFDIHTYFDAEEFARRVYAKVISYAFAAYAEQSDVFVTILVSVKDSELDSIESTSSEISLDFRFSEDNVHEKCTWGILHAPKQKNTNYLNIENIIYSVLNSELSASHTYLRMTQNP